MDFFGCEGTWLFGIISLLLEYRYDTFNFFIEIVRQALLIDIPVMRGEG